MSTRKNAVTFYASKENDEYLKSIPHGQRSWLLNKALGEYIYRQDDISDDTNSQVQVQLPSCRCDEVDGRVDELIDSFIEDVDSLKKRLSKLEDKLSTIDDHE
jgi:hypothetical protein